VAFFLTRRHEVFAIDAASGAPVWHQSTGSVGETTEGARILLVPSLVIAGDDAVVALRRADGRVMWRAKPPGAYGLGRYLGSASDTTVFTGSPQGRLYAIDVASGTLRWSLDLQYREPATVFEPVLKGHAVFAGFTVFSNPSLGGVLGVDADTGLELWRTTFDGVGTTWAGGPAVARDLVICAGSTGRLIAFDRKSGAVRWSIERGEGLPSHDFRPLTARGSAIAVGSLAGEVERYDLTSRTLRWRHAGQDGSVAFGLVEDGRAVYVATLGGRLTALNAIDGHVLWRTHPVQGRFTWPPAVAGGRVYASAPDRLVAFGAAQ
jgi:outer membrane protein assembly factor BamB